MFSVMPKYCGSIPLAGIVSNLLLDLNAEVPCSESPCVAW